MNRRNFIKTLTIGTIGASAVSKSLAQVFSGTEKRETTPSGVSIQYHLPLMLEQQSIIEQTIQNYHKLYGYPHPKITIHQFTPKNAYEAESLAIAEPGEIYFNKNSLPYVNNHQLKNIVSHESFHTLKPLSPHILKTPIKLPDGNNIYGTHGLSFLIKLQNGETTKFSGLEEGFAEYFAFQSHTKYQSITGNYSSLQVLCRKCIQENLLKEIEVIDAMKNNSLSTIIKKLTGDRKAQNYILLMDIIQQARNPLPDGNINKPLLEKLVSKLKALQQTKIQ